MNAAVTEEISSLKAEIRELESLVQMADPDQSVFGRNRKRLLMAALERRIEEIEFIAATAAGPIT